MRAALGDALHACAHITGGGIVGNLPRALPDDLGAVLERSAWDEPRVFTEIQRLGSVAEDEMDRVFNRGVGHGAGGRRRLGAARPCGRWSRRGQPASVIGEVVGRARRGPVPMSGADDFAGLRDAPAGALGQDGRLHPQVRAQEQLVHRLQADGLPARGHAARGRRRALGRPRRGHGHRRAHHGRRPRRLRHGRGGRHAGSAAEGLQRAQGGEGPRRRAAASPARSTPATRWW